MAKYIRKFSRGVESRIVLNTIAHIMSTDHTLSKSNVEKVALIRLEEKYGTVDRPMKVAVKSALNLKYDEYKEQYKHEPVRKIDVKTGLLKRGVTETSVSNQDVSNAVNSVFDVVKSGLTNKSSPVPIISSILRYTKKVQDSVTEKTLTKDIKRIFKYDPKLEDKTVIKIDDGLSARKKIEKG